MRQVEHVTKELISAQKELDKWKKRVLALQEERRAVLQAHNNRFSVDVV